MATDSSSGGTSGKATASLICGLLAFCIPLVPGLTGLILGLVSLGDIKRSGGRLGGKGLAITGIIASVLGTLFSCGAILLYGGYRAVEAVGTSARTAGTMNNLKQIGLAMHNYHSATMAFPAPMTRTPNGQPGLSWRVQILPYIEENALYQRFHHDEPWDSPHNKALLTEMPRIYARAGEYVPGVSQNTPFQVFVGPGTAFENRKDPIRLTDIIDGTSNTFMVVEAREEVPWTKPQDIVFDPAAPLPPLGMVGRSYFLALTCDGAVFRIPVNTDEKTLKALVTINGKESVTVPH
jgi:hypothetical protein